MLTGCVQQKVKHEQLNLMGRGRGRTSSRVPNVTEFTTCPPYTQVEFVNSAVRQARETLVCGFVTLGHRGGWYYLFLGDDIE